jgi:hypothetical protein
MNYAGYRTGDLGGGSLVKLLMFQAKRFWWKSFSKTLEDVPDVDVEETVTGAVIVFLHAEEEDETKGNRLLTKVLKNIKWLANKRGLKNIILHSFTHLSDSTASQDYAQAFLESAAERLRGTGYSVWLTPFGYFCEWELSVYGESLAKVFKAL